MVIIDDTLVNEYMNSFATRSKGSMKSLLLGQQLESWNMAHMKEAQVIAAELVTGLTMKSHETPLTPCDLDLETSPSILFAISRHHHTAWKILHAFGDPKVP